MNDRIETQHAQKKLHACERILLLLDKDSFREIGSGVNSYRFNHDTGGSSKSTEYDGVITGRGTIAGKTVFVFAQDFTVSGGSIGLNHGRKIARTIALAIEARCPVIGIFDSGGARIEEGINALAGCGEFIFQNVRASGVIPQISVVAGPCAGAAAYSLAISDFVFAVKQIGQIYITGNKVIEQVTGEKCDLQELGGAKLHAELSGVAHFLHSSERKCFAEVRRLISVLPSHWEDKAVSPSAAYTEGSGGASLRVPTDTKLPYSMSALIEAIFDTDSFLEVHRLFAANILTGFATLCGRTVGVIANNPQIKSGCLDRDSSDKAARFVRFCDAYSIPLITFVDTPGYLPGMEEERGGIVRHGAKLLYAYSEATTVKLTVIVRKAYGGAYIAMCSRQLGADYVYASPLAELAVMGADGAVSILHHRELANAGEQERALRETYVQAYREQYMNSSVASAEGYIDEILEFSAMRKRLFEDISALEKKKAETPPKKHGNIPL